MIKESKKTFWRNLRRGLVGLAGLATLIAIFYTVENWRGKRAWENYKRETESNGAVFDWNALIPPPVQDEQNIFKAPKMAEWFAGKGMNELGKRLSPTALAEFSKQNNDSVAELTIVSPSATFAAEDADLVFRYDHSVLYIATPQENSTNDSDALIIPLLAIDDAPLLDAIKNLARQANLKFVLDPKVSLLEPASPKGPASPRPNVSFRWENVTARQALLALLQNYDLLWIDDPKTGIARVIPRDPDKLVYAETEVRKQLETLVQNAVLSGTNGSQTPSLTGSQDLVFVASPLNKIKPIRIFVRSEKIPSIKEVTEFFPKDSQPPALRLKVESVGTNSFRVWPNPSPYYTAADYLAWSDQFESEFKIIREALNRPYARMDGDYQQPYEIPIPNFITVRSLVQTLAQRAQCHLLLGEPEKALRELTLIHDMSRLLEGRPTSKPMTLVAAMINVAITGLYVSAIADGMDLQAWSGPQLAVLQEQLQEINLMTFVLDGFRCERVATCHTLETVKPSKLASIFKFTPVNETSKKENLWEKIKDEGFLLGIVPRGWIYQNMMTHAKLMGKTIDAIDSTNQLILPRKQDEAAIAVDAIVSNKSPYTFITSISIPNFSRATQRLGQNQTMANEAAVVCALERYRMARGQYPVTLDALVPDFIKKAPHDVIGGDPLKYRRTDDGKFLLYSVGWNEKDDGGTPGKDLNDNENGDWVWRNPAK